MILQSSTHATILTSDDYGYIIPLVCRFGLSPAIRIYQGSSYTDASAVYPNLWLDQGLYFPLGGLSPSEISKTTLQRYNANSGTSSITNGTGITMFAEGVVCDKGKNPKVALCMAIGNTSDTELVAYLATDKISVLLTKYTDTDTNTTYWLGDIPDTVTAKQTIKVTAVPTITNNISHTTAEYTSISPYGIKVTADDGYTFVEEPTVSYYDTTTGYTKTAALTVSDDGTTATITGLTISAQYPVELKGEVIDGSTPVKPTITNNIANSTATYTGTNPFTLTVTANDGHIFDGTPTATYTDSTGVSQTSSFELTDNTTATLTTSELLSTDLNITLNGATKKESTTPTITNNITNSTATYTGSDHQYYITVKANTGYVFSGDVTATYTGYSASQELSSTFAVSSDGTTATGVCPDVDESIPIIITGNTEKTSTAAVIKTDLTNCTLDGTLPETIQVGASISVTVKANANTHFENAPRFLWDNESGYIEKQLMTLSDDGKTATGTFTNPYSHQYVTVYGNAVPDSTIADKYGTINAYIVTMDELKEFSKARFFKEATDSDGTTFTLINLGEYVNRVKRLFCTVGTYSTDVIKCGNYNTKVSCSSPMTDNVTLNFGTITIPSPNGDSTDYHSVIQLFIPFHGMVSIPVDYVGKDVALTYDINTITGDGVAKLSCDDTIFAYYDVQPNEDVLYQTNLDNLATIGGDEWNSAHLYGLEPYLYMKYYNSLNKDEPNNDYTRAKLGDLTGLCRVDEITLCSSEKMTSDEEKEIINLLSQGVFFGS